MKNGSLLAPGHNFRTISQQPMHCISCARGCHPQPAIRLLHTRIYEHPIPSSKSMQQTNAPTTREGSKSERPQAHAIRDIHPCLDTQHQRAKSTILRHVVLRSQKRVNTSLSIPLAKRTRRRHSALGAKALASPSRNLS